MRRVPAAPPWAQARRSPDPQRGRPPCRAKNPRWKCGQSRSPVRWRQTARAAANVRTTVELFQASKEHRPGLAGCIRRDMVAERLVELIEIQAHRLTADVAEDLITNDRTAGFRDVRRPELVARRED